MDSPFDGLSRTIAQVGEKRLEERREYERYIIQLQLRIHELEQRIAELERTQAA